MTIYIVEELQPECHSWHPRFEWGMRYTSEDGIKWLRRIKQRFPTFRVRLARYERMKEIVDNAVEAQQCRI